MTEFVNLQEDEELSKDINSYIKVDTEDQVGSVEITTLPTYTKEDDTESVCVCSECVHPKEDESGYFTIDNLFSELTNDYQRNIAKNNLGIGTAYDLIWENIQGNPKNSSLYNAVINGVNDANTNLSTSVNKSMQELMYYVQNYVSKGSSSELLYFNMNPIEVDYIGNPINITINWEYTPTITVLEQSLNGVTIDPQLRTYTYSNISNTLTITLKYKYKEITSTYTVTCNIYYPIFYGTSSNINEASGKRNFPITVTANTDQYIYVFTQKKQDLYVNGFIGGFAESGTTTKYGITYYVYKSCETNLGTITIKSND